MSKDAKVIDTLFNNKWNGASPIHRSVFKEFDTNKDDEAMVTTMFEYLGAQYDWEGVEWFLTVAELKALLIYLIGIKRSGELPPAELASIKNPATGNIFVPIFRKGMVIGSIRVLGGGTYTGFRIRYVVAENAEDGVIDAEEQLNALVGVLKVRSAAKVTEVEGKIKSKRIAIAPKAKEKPVGEKQSIKHLV